MSAVHGGEGSGTTPGPDPTYPLPRPAEGDRRFTLGLALDVADVLVRHGFPPVEVGADLGRLHQSLWRFLYGPEVTR